MKPITPITVLLLFFCTTAFGANAVPAKADIDKAVASLKAYQFGQPRTPLSEVERIVNATAADRALRLHAEQQLVGLLDGNLSEETRFFICRQLAAIGTDASVPVLQKMLVDDKTVHPASFALLNNKSNAAGKALRDAMTSAKGNALVCIVSTLGDRRDRASVAALVKLAENSDAAVAEASISALGRISGEEAASALAEMRGAAKGKARDVVTDAWLQCALGLAAEGKKEQAAAIYRQLLSKDQPLLYSRGALSGLVDLGGPEVVATLISTIGGDDRVMQAAAISHVRRLKGEGVTERFAAELSRLPESLQAMLIAALEDRGDPAARAAVTAATSSRSDEVRAAAVKALGALGDAQSVSLLMRVASEGKTEAEKRAALASLRHIAGEGIDSAIIEGMQAARPELRVQLIELLTARNTPAAVAAMLKEAQGDNTPVRVAALRALSQLAGPESLSAIIDILVNLQGDAARADAESTIVALARKQSDEATRADAVLSALASARSTAAKASLLRVLRAIANAKAYDAVLAAAKDNDAQVQDAAIRALSDWPDARATDAVLAICRTTRNQTHRIVAMRGAVRLLGLNPVPSAQVLRAYDELVKLSARPEENRLVLGGLANVAHPHALAIAQSFLKEDAVSAEAAVAMLSIARTIKGAYRNEVAAAMKTLAQTSKDQAIRNQAQQTIDQIGKFGDYITAWLVSGPYLREGLSYGALIGVAFEPEKMNATGLPWRILPACANPAKPTFLDLAAMLGGEQRVAYVRTWIVSDKAQDAVLELGVDDGAKVWLDGNLIHSKTTPGACIPGSEKVNVSLKQGPNLLFMKIIQNTGPWEFCARLTARDGKPLSGIRVNCEMDPETR